MNPRYLVACGCGRQVTAAESQAGSMLPCADCGRQVAVPPLSRMGRLPRAPEDGPTTAPEPQTRFSIVTLESALLFGTYCAAWAACGAVSSHSAEIAVRWVPTSLVVAIAIVTCTSRCGFLHSAIFASAVWFVVIWITVMFLLFTYPGEDVGNLGLAMAMWPILLVLIFLLVPLIASLILGIVSGIVLGVLRRKVL